MENTHIKIYKGKGLKLHKKEKKNMKVFVFDLDETIGHFSEIYILFQFIEMLKKKHNCTFFQSEKECLFYLLDLFPEVFRYGINIIFTYLHKKKQKFSTNVYIYTNNTCIPITWTTYISQYIEEKWNIHGLFTNIVRAFKINGKILENRRTTGEKTYYELLHCVQLPENTELCFIDNTEYIEMKHRYVYYLQPKPFYIDLSRFTIINHFFDNFKKKCHDTLDLRDEINNYYNEQNYTITDISKSNENKTVDINISKKMLHCIQKFYKYKLVKIHTRKKRSSVKNQTLKKRS